MVALPGASQRILSGKSTVALSPQVITVHTMAGTIAGTEAWFTPSGRPYSHLGVPGAGRVRQWQRLDRRAASDLEGNWRSISIECEDMGASFPGWSGSNVPAFTPHQIETLIVTLSWLCHRFGLPRSAIGTSCNHERGIGWHRLGIDHSTRNPDAPGGPWRRPHCPRWSSGAGKVCPGDRRIHQLRTLIIPRVSAPVVAPPTSPVPMEDDEMLLVRNPSGAYFLLSGGRLAGIGNTTDLAALRKAGIKDFSASEGTWRRWSAAFQVQH